MTEELKPEWRLKDLRIYYREYGEYKGSYIGNISFENKQEESFSFKLTPELSNRFLLLIKECVVDCAQNLGDRLIKSLPATPEKSK